MKKYILIFLLALLSLGKINFAHAEDDFLNNDSLFELTTDSAQNDIKSPFSLSVDNNTIYLNKQKGAYIYDSSLLLFKNGRVINFTIDQKPTLHTDAQGSSKVYFDDLKINFKNDFKDGDYLSFIYQGCDQKGICYSISTNNYIYKANQFQSVDKVPFELNLTVDKINGQNDSDYLNQALQNNFILGLLFCLGFGILLNLTPCIIPMLPIFSAMIVGQSKTTLSSLRLNIAYALGLAICFGILGVIFSYTGALAQGFLQSPIVSSILSLLLVVFALISFNVLKVNLSSSKFNGYIQDKIANGKRGSFSSAFILGMLSALIASPCTSAPLAGALLYVLSTGNTFFGAIAFFTIGLGMSIPLFIVGLIGSSAIKRVSAISSSIKSFIGLLLLLCAFYISKNNLGHYGVYILFAIIFIGLLFVLIKKHKKTYNLIAIVFALALASVGSFAYKQYFYDSAKLFNQYFTQVKNLDDLNQYKGKKIILDFNAKWCTNCIVMENNVFTNNKFIQASDNYTRLSFDITKTNDPEVKEFIEHFNVIGVPHVIILDENLKEQKSITGLTELDKMLEFVR